MKKDKGYGQYDFSSKGVIKDFQTDLKYVKSDSPKRRNNLSSRNITINVNNSPRHVITEDYKDYYNRRRLKNNMDDCLLLYIAGIIFLIIGIATFNTNGMYALISVLFGGFCLYLGIKYGTKASKRYRNHFRR